MAKLKDGFYKQTAEAIGSDLYVLLAGGGMKPLADFANASSVAYADKAGDSDKLGGLPASYYLKVQSLSESTSKSLSDKVWSVGTTNRGDDSTQNECPTYYGAYLSLQYDASKNTGYQLYGNTASSTPTLYVRNRQAGNSHTTYNEWKQIAFTSDIPTVTNYYWADQPITSNSKADTTPTFSTATATKFLSKWFGGTNTTDGGLFGDASMIIGSGYTGAVVYSYGDAPIWFHTGSKLRMILDKDGKLGINNNSPAHTLHVSGTTYSDRAVIGLSESDANKYVGNNNYYNLAVAYKNKNMGGSILLWRPDTTKQATITWCTDTGDHAYVGLGADTNDLQITNTKGSILSNGIFVQQKKNQWLDLARVQIGRVDTTVYTDRGCVGTTNGNLHLDAYRGGSIYLNYYQAPGTGGQASTALVINSAGNVGIGVESYSQKLTVNGNALLKETTVDAGYVTAHTPSASGWYTVAQVSGYFNFDIYISGGWNHGMPSTIRANICNINGAAYIMQLAGYAGGHCSSIRLGRVSTDTYDVQVYIFSQSGSIGTQVCSFVGYGGIETYTASTVSTTSYAATTELAFKTLSGRFYTESEADSRFVNVAGDTMTGGLYFTDAKHYVQYYKDSSLSYLELYNQTGGCGIAIHDDGRITHNKAGTHNILIHAGNISNYLPVVTNYYWADQSITSSAKANTTPTFGNVSISSGTDAGLSIKTTGDYARIRFYNSAGSNNATIHYFATAYSGYSFAKDSLNLGGSGLITLGGWNNPTMVISNNTTTSNSDGKVGIGTVNPSYKLEVIGDTKVGALVLFDNNSSNSTKKSYWGIYGWDERLSFTKRNSSNVYQAEYMTIVYDSGNVGIGMTSPQERLHINGNFKIQGTSNTSTKPDIYLGYYTSWQGGTYPTLMSGYTSKWIMHFNPHIARSDSSDMPGANIRMESTGGNYYDLSVAYDGNNYFRLRYNNNKNLVTVNNSGQINIINGIVMSGSIGAGVGSYLVGNDSTGVYLAANESGKKLYLESTNQSCPYFRNKNGDYTIWHSGNDGSGSGLNADLLDGFHVNTGSEGKCFGKIPVIGSDGVTELGHYIDWHYDNTTTSDFSTRLYVSGNYGNTVCLPSASGTLALTSHSHSNYIEKYISVNSKDMNTIKDPGFYYGYNMSNAAKTDISTFIVNNYSNDWGSQLQLCAGNQRMYIRFWQGSGGVMQSWNTIAFTSDIPTSLPANGGNADTLDGYHASSFFYYKGGLSSASSAVSGVGLYGWATSSGGFGETYGDSIVFQGYSSWYRRLDFGTSGRIRFWQGINTTTMSNVGTLAYTYDIPTKTSQLTNDSGFLTSLPSHSHSYLPLSGGTVTGTIYLGNSTHYIQYYSSGKYVEMYNATGGCGISALDAGYVNVMGTGGIYASAFYQSSDINLKTNIENISDSDNIPQLKKFNWKSDGSVSYGLIAQELEDMGYSELVSNEGDHKTVNYSAALSLIVGKLQVKIKELEKEIEILKTKKNYGLE